MDWESKEPFHWPPPWGRWNSIDQGLTRVMLGRHRVKDDSGWCLTEVYLYNNGSNWADKRWSSPYDVCDGDGNYLAFFDDLLEVKCWLMEHGLLKG